MPYRLKTGESLQDGIRRVINEQVERTLGELADTNLDRADTIHQVRKRCKKICAALRLVRGALGNAYSRENAWYRDASRRISGIRDTEVMIETCNALTNHFVDQIDCQVIRYIHRQLEARRKALTEDTVRIEKLLQDFESAMEAGHKRVATLSIAGDGYEPALAGMRKTYARARVTMYTAYDNPVPEAFHQWRKWVKYHWYHMRLLHAARPSVVRIRRNAANKLGESLGNHHDLSVLRTLMLSDPSLSAKKDVLVKFIKLIDKRTAQIERKSKPLGRRLFAEKPKHLDRRFALYLNTWSEED